eukprot:tig00020554_g10850.t1
MTSSAKEDPCTLSNYMQLRCVKLQLDLEVKFESQTIAGSALWTCQAQTGGVDALVLDTSHLVISGVYDASSGAKLNHSLEDEKDPFGRPLRISLGRALSKGEETRVRVDYSTTRASSAIQWLEPAQTAGKKHPFVFSQCQAIHARSLLPCQDAPGVKFTYEATVTVPDPLRAIMSALPKGAQPVGAGRSRHSFEQPVPISSYLVAVAAGDLAERKIGPRSSVYAEHPVVEAAAHEFADTERFLAAGEALLGPYVWGRYDLLVMPPSFPYGGMENPVVTFVTPTLLAGDRSLANVVAHEIAHSWMGNLVTNEDWRSFWLNEGNTVFVERKIIEAMEEEGHPGAGAKHFDLHAAIGLKELRDSVEQYGEDPHGFTKLVPDLTGVDPDDAFSSVPYEKGFLLLHAVRSLVGDKAFCGFLRDYVEHFKNRTLGAHDWRAFVVDYFRPRGVDLEARIDFDTWFNARGVPPYEPALDGSLIGAARALAARWLHAEGDLHGAAPADLAGWGTPLKVLFLDELVGGAGRLKEGAAARLDAAYALSAVRNAEVRFRWQTLRLRLGDAAVVPAVKAFLAEQGRMKFVRPLFRDLAKLPGGAGAREARGAFGELGAGYHAIAVKMIERDLSAIEAEAK